MRDSAKTSDKGGIGLVALALKLGTKLLPILAKISKIGLKLGLLAGSFATYAYLWNWRFAVVLLVSLFIHEMGHVWAMNLFGVPHGGVNFIPLLGAIIVPKKNFPSAKAEAVIGIMGPVWGCTLAFIAYIVYIFTDEPLVAAIAAWIAAFNLFNLLPIMPLDGGRVMYSVASSLGSRMSIVFYVASVVLAVVVTGYFKLILVSVMFVLGFFEVLGRWQAEADIPNRKENAEKIRQAMDKDYMRSIVEIANEIVPASGWWKFLKKSRFASHGEVYAYMDTKNLASLPKMAPGMNVLLFAGYLCLIALLFVLMMAVSDIPGALHALEVFKES